MGLDVIYLRISMGLNKRILFVIKALALKTPYPKIKQDFHIFFEEKITGEEIMAIEDKYKEEIEEEAEQELNNIRKNPLAHSRIRLDILNRAMEYALKPQGVRSIKVGDNEYETIMDINHQAIAKYVQLSRDEEYLAKRLLLEKIKLDLDIHNATGFEPVEIDTGFTQVKQIEQA